ncbi:MAG: PorV/PorQ family protein [Candidatus Goldiibacteriota bacterium]
MLKKGFILAAVVLFYCSNVYAQGAGTTGLNFLKISQGARQSGMGEAFTGIADDVNALFWNPAGLTQISRHQACLMHNSWLLDVNIEYLAYAVPFGSAGAMGLYITSLNTGDMLRTIEDEGGDYILTEENVNASNLSVNFAFAKKLSDFFADVLWLDGFSAALALSYSNEDVAGDSGSGFGFSLSTFYTPRYDDYSFGVVLQNIGFTDNRPPLPAAVTLGFGYRFSFEKVMQMFSEEAYFNFPENDASFGLDLTVYPGEQIVRMNTGAEKYWQLNKYHTVAARAGYKFGYDLGILSGFTAGLGYRLTAGDMNFEIDYALAPQGDLGMSHRISLTGKFFGKPGMKDTVNKKEAVEFYERGYRLLYEQKYSLAISEFYECLKRDKTYSSAYIGIGTCLQNMGKKDLALKAYEKALEYNPSNDKLKKYIERMKWGDVQF